MFLFLFFSVIYSFSPVATGKDSTGYIEDSDPDIEDQMTYCVSAYIQIRMSVDEYEVYIDTLIGLRLYINNHRLISAPMP